MPAVMVAGSVVHAKPRRRIARIGVSQVRRRGTVAACELACLASGMLTETATGSHTALKKLSSTTLVRPNCHFLLTLMFVQLKMLFHSSHVMY
jgi:hypothetical protein